MPSSPTRFPFQPLLSLTLVHSLLLPFLHQHAKCAACHGPLEPPTISFLCLHSYHPACLGDYDTECLVCTPQRKRIAEHLTQQRGLARGKEDFFLMEVVKQSGGGGAQGDGFGAIADMVGRGLLADVAGER